MGALRSASRATCHCCIFDVRPRDVRPEPPALAFGSRSSVFKERPGTRPWGASMQSPRRPRCTRIAVRFVPPNGSDMGRFGGKITLPARLRGVNRPAPPQPGPGRRVPERAGPASTIVQHGGRAGAASRSEREWLGTSAALELLSQDVCVPAVLGELAQHMEEHPAQREGPAPVPVDQIVQPQR